MKMWKRTILSIKSRPAQMIIMFLIVFVLGNVLFASIAVKQSSDNVKSDMRRRIPTQIEISRADTEVSTLEPMKQFVEDIKKDKDVSEVEIRNLYQFVIEENFEFDGVVNNFMSSKVIREFNNINDKIVDFKIVEGRNYTQDDLDGDAPKVVISDSLKEYYKLKLYDKISIPIYDYEYVDGELPDDPNNAQLAFKDHTIIPKKIKEIEFEIIGFFDSFDYYKKLEQMNGGYSFQPMYAKWTQAIYDEYLTVNENHKSNEIENTYYGGEKNLIDSEFGQSLYVDSVTIHVNGMDALERLENEIKENPNYVNEGYVLKTSASDYRYIQAPLENLVALANVAMLASALLVVVLLSLVSMWFIRARQHEIGILMALGERKHKILGQFVCEILLVGLLASSFSMISGNALGSTISNEFMRIQIDTENEIKYEQKNEGSLTQLDMLETYKVEMNVEYILTIYAMSAVILLLSSGVPVLTILKMKPKDVLM